MVEIDLSEFVHEDRTKEQLREHIHEAARTRWIHNPVAFNVINEFESSKKQYIVNPNGTIQRLSATWNSSIPTIGYPSLLFSNEKDY